MTSEPRGFEVIVNTESWKSLAVSAGVLTATTRPARSEDVLFKALIADDQGRVFLEHGSGRRVYASGREALLTDNPGHEDQVWRLWGDILKPEPKAFNLVHQTSGRRLFAQKTTNGDGFGTTTGWQGHPDQSFLRFPVALEDCIICNARPGSTRPDRRCRCTIPAPYCCTECADEISTLCPRCPMCNCDFQF